MKGRHEDVETYPVSQPCEVDGLSQIWPLPGICYGVKVDSPQV